MYSDEAWNAVVDFAARRHGTFSSTEAAHRGMTTRRLKRGVERGELRRLHNRVYALAAHPITLRQQMMAATLAIDGSAVSHAGAAWLGGMTDVAPCRIDLWVPSRARTTLPPIRLHRSSAIDPVTDVTVADSIPVVNRAATLVHLGALEPPAVVERCLDEFLRTGSPVWLERTIDRMGTARCHGLGALRGIMNDPSRLAGVTDSWMERVLANLVSQPDLPPAVLQHVVGVDGDKFRIDLAFPELLLGVEAHSRTFHWGPAKADADNVRELRLGAVGWQLVYVTWSQLNDPDEFVRLLSGIARQRSRMLMS